MGGRRVKAGTRIDCKHCGRSGYPDARGLIKACYRALKQLPGGLDPYPPLAGFQPVKGPQQRTDRMLDAYCRLTKLGWNRAEIADELRISKAALDRAVLRARGRGDPRAVYLRDYAEPPFHRKM